MQLVVVSAERIVRSSLGPTASVRLARNSDQSAIAAFVTKVRAEFSLSVPLGIETDLLDIEGAYHQQGGVFLLIEENGLLGTFAFVPVSENCGEFRKLYLAPEIRGLGLGTRLVRLLLEHARKLGIRSAKAETNPRLTGRGLFARTGFEVAAPKTQRASSFLLPDDFIMVRPIKNP